MPTRWSPETIRKLRKAYGESQPEFARRFRVTVDAFRLWEQGRQPASGMATVILDFLEEALAAHTSR